MLSVSYCDIHLISSENKKDSNQNRKGRFHYEETN